jgi:hypothetical protein
MDPAQIALEFAQAVVAAMPALFRLFQQLGSRDAFLAALDAALIAARAKTDADLEAKHRRG